MPRETTPATPPARAAAAGGPARRPLLVTQGDVCGIGPEIILKAWRARPADDLVVVGDPAVLRRAAGWLRERPDGPGLPLAVLDAGADLSAEATWAALPPGALPVLPPPGGLAGLLDAPVGRVDARAGAAAAACIREAVRRVLAGQGRALVTAPIHKEALAAAGEPYPGHTEMLAAEAARHGRPCDVRMMLANPELKTVLVTIHQSLRSAIDAITFDAVLDTVRIADRAARAWSATPPRIAVAGLNPHAGEGGLFGNEEQRIIGPAVQAAQAEGIAASGPHAPDTVFMRARRGEFDLVVALYHDQGLIPVKYLGVEEGVNVSLGLPFVRTSPDHGTAFDLAGTGRADPASLLAAIDMARRLAP